MVYKESLEAIRRRSIRVQSEMVISFWRCTTSSKISIAELLIEGFAAQESSIDA